MKWLGFLVLWTVGTAAAVAVAWQGVSVVDDQVISPAPATALEDLDGTGSDASGGDETTGDTGSPDTGTADTSPDDTRSGETGSEETSSPSGSDGTGGDPAPTPPPSDDPAPAVTATVRPDPTATVRPRPTATDRPRPTERPRPTATVRPDEAEVRTYTLVGGTTAVSFSPSGVEVLWATPAPGFVVEVHQGDSVRVEFRGEDHRSRLDASWSDGPVAEVREDED